MRKLHYKVVNDKIIVSSMDNKIMFVIPMVVGKEPIDTIEEYMSKKDMYIPMYELELI